MSEIKVNKISPRAACGTVQLGDSGDTFTIPAGATINNQGTATNFGATGSASWNTTVKTGDFTAVAGEGYFVNTTSGEVTVSLPAGTAGAVVAIKDYAGTFDTNKVTVSPNGSDKIAGVNTSDGTLTVEGVAVTFIFVDSTQGWLVTDSGLQSDMPTAEYVAATGGNTTLTVCSHKVHIFTGPGTLCVSGAGNPAGSNTVEYLVVAGGAGGGLGADNNGYKGGGGGGAGGWRSFTALSPASPLNGPAALPVSVQGYPITVGAGGAGAPGQPTPGASGSNSIFSSITSAGGGGGGSNEGPPQGNGVAGGSGGGGAGRNDNQPGPSIGGTGNTPPVSPAQGTNGGTGAKNSPGCASGGGAGGASAAGSNTPSATVGGAGGAGTFITAPFIGPTAPSYGATGPAGRYFSGGGGGASGNNPGPSGAGGLGGGGAGGTGAVGSVAGTANTGGGGGGTTACGTTKAGGSGIVIIRYKFQA